MPTTRPLPGHPPAAGHTAVARTQGRHPARPQPAADAPLPTLAPGAASLVASPPGAHVTDSLGGCGGLRGGSAGGCLRLGPGWGVVGTGGLAQGRRTGPGSAEEQQGHRQGDEHHLPLASEQLGKTAVSIPQCLLGQDPNVFIRTEGAQAVTHSTVTVRAAPKPRVVPGVWLRQCHSWAPEAPRPSGGFLLLPAPASSISGGFTRDQRAGCLPPTSLPVLLCPRPPSPLHQATRLMPVRQDRASSSFPSWRLPGPEAPQRPPGVTPAPGS